MAASPITIASGFIRSILLARLLAPEQFGVVALAMFFFGLLNRGTDFGFKRAFIYRSEDIGEATSTYFVLTVGSALLMALVTLLLGPLLRQLYPAQPEMISVLIVLSLINILAAMNSTPDVLLRKQLEFKYIAALDVASSLAMTIGAPAMAWAGLGYWSLVGEQAIPVVIRAFGLWGFGRPWQPSIKFNKEIARWYFRFGLSVFASLNLTYLLDRFDDFWTGTALGAHALGFYSRAYEFARYPRRAIGAPITQVLFPAYARLQHDRLRLSKAYYRTSSFLVRMGFVLSLVFALVVPEFVRLFIGAKWLPMVSTFRLMIPYALLDPLFNTSDHLITAVGYPQIIARIKGCQLLAFVPAVVLMARFWGINGVAIAADLMLATGLILALIQVRRFVDFSLWRVFRYPALALVLATGAALVTNQALATESDILRLLTKGGAATAVYAVSLLLLERDEFMKALQLVFDLIKPRGLFAR
jgi:O-antigen/teichoic acid export membrane protein